MSFRPVDALDSSNMVLDLIAKKQKVIGNNLANVNTPGYLREDIDFERYIGALKNPIETKLSKTIGPSPLMDKKGGEVSVTQELMALQKNSIFYTVASRRVTMLIQELKSVAQLGR